MKAIIFDLDGTLIDSMPMWRDLASNYLKDKGIELDSKTAKEMTTLSLQNSSELLSKRYNINKSAKEIFGDFRKIALHYYENDVEEKEGAIDVVKRAKEKGFKLILGTASNIEFLKPALRKLNILDLFDYIQTCDMVGVMKDKEEYYKIISEKIDIKEKYIYLFDDAHFALEAAKKAGLKTVGVYDETSKQYWEDVKKVSDFYIESFEQWCFS